jgi:hypothetical protein
MEQNYAERNGGRWVDLEGNARIGLLGVRLLHEETRVVDWGIGCSFFAFSDRLALLSCSFHA